MSTTTPLAPATPADPGAHRPDERAGPPPGRATLRRARPLSAENVPYHPLEFIPIFSRWRPSLLRDLVYTFIFNTLMGLLFVALGLVFSTDVTAARVLQGRFLLTQLVIAQCIGFAIYGLIMTVDALLMRGREVSALFRWTLFTAASLVGAYIGYWIATFVLGWSQPRAELLTWRGVLSVFTVAMVITLVLLALFIPRERAARAEARAARDAARVSAAERETTLARMQLLEAQVEPHFLYNTLAHVMSLVDAEPALAKRMLHRLIDLLRATAAAGGQATTVESQTTLLRAYLDLIGMRMGARLAWTVEVEPGLGGAPIAPMLLQPVVENAIKHGLEPRIEGGRVDVRVRRRGERMVLTVADTGLGVAPTRDPRSTGLGLPNLRARLAALHGSDASFAIADNVPQGTVVTIELPLGETR